MNNLTGKYILNKKGNPIEEPNLIRWAKFLEEPNNRIVKQERIGHYLVSTVFLGLDYNYFGKKPLLFETMVFDESKKEKFKFGDKKYTVSRDLEQERYSTRKQALAGHNKMVKKYDKKK